MCPERSKSSVHNSILQTVHYIKLSLHTVFTYHGTLPRAHRLDSGTLLDTSLAAATIFSLFCTPFDPWHPNRRGVCDRDSQPESPEEDCRTWRFQLPSQREAKAFSLFSTPAAASAECVRSTTWRAAIAQHQSCRRHTAGTPALKSAILNGQPRCISEALLRLGTCILIHFPTPTP